MEALQLPRPKFDTQLVGRRLEICWPYKKDAKTIKIWASGCVKRVADGLTHKRTERCTSTLPAGALLWAWDADAEFDERAGEQWIVLHPDKFNKHVHVHSTHRMALRPVRDCTGGRHAVVSPERRQQRRAREREQVVDECVTDDEFYE